jgi:hypothetical protein
VEGRGIQGSGWPRDAESVAKPDRVVVGRAGSREQRGGRAREGSSVAVGGRRGERTDQEAPDLSEGTGKWGWPGGWSERATVCTRVEGRVEMGERGWSGWP